MTEEKKTNGSAPMESVWMTIAKSWPFLLMFGFYIYNEQMNNFSAEERRAEMEKYRIERTYESDKDRIRAIGALSDAVTSLQQAQAVQIANARELGVAILKSNVQEEKFHTERMALLREYMSMVAELQTIYVSLVKAVQVDTDLMREMIQAVKEKP